MRVFSRSRYVIAVAIGLPIALFAGYISYLIVPVIVSAVVPSVVRSVTGS